MNNQNTRRLRRQFLHTPSPHELMELEGERRKWLRVWLWLTCIAVVVGTSLRRPLRGDYGLIDLTWAMIFAFVASVLALGYRRWQRHSYAESTALLAQIRKDTLLVYPRPGVEQRVPLIGASAIEIANVDNGEIELKVVQPAAMGATHRVALSKEEADAVVAFVNDVLEKNPWHRL